MALHQQMATLTGLAATIILLGVAVRAQNADQILQKTRDTYAVLKSYSDSGAVVVEYGTSSVDRHSFSTSFNRAPRRFLLDFRKQGGGRYVIWGDPDAYHTWNNTTGQQFDYPNPNNASAISLSGQSTKGASGIIPQLLYSKAALGGLFNNVADMTTDATEAIGGRNCYRLVGRASDTYGATGKEVNVRKVTVWIDAQSSLVRQVREEWKPLPGQRNRNTIIFQPQANPAFDESKVKFTPPAQ